MTTSVQPSRLPVTAILARLILLRHNKNLPEPAEIDTMAHGLVTVRLGSLADCHVWLRALGGKRESLTLTEFDHRPENRHSYQVWTWADSGWRVSVFADVDRAEKVSGLDVATVAGLEAVAHA